MHTRRRYKQDNMILGHLVKLQIKGVTSQIQSSRNSTSNSQKSQHKKNDNSTSIIYKQHVHSPKANIHVASNEIVKINN